MGTIDKIKTPRNLTALAYDSIRAYILEGDLDEDTRLTEEFLSTQLGISKSPVREALNSLRTEGLIQIEARRGAYLRRFSVKDAKDLYELRETLEVYAVSVAALSPQLLAELRSSIERTRKFLKANDKAGHIDEDARFHGLIANATGNAELCRILTNVQSQIWLCRRKTYNLSSTTAPEAHQTILDALAKSDRKTAQNAMRDHIAFVRERLLEFMDEK
jgi:DNA-binding GntR family transcriptional regulator